MGISFGDFLEMTPDEFDAAYEAWLSRQEALMHERWEQCRWICFYTIRPYGKKSLRPKDVMKFGWDDKAAGVPKKDTVLDKKKHHEEFERLLELWKDE